MRVSYDDEQVVAHVKWYVGDIRRALVDAGYEGSDENIAKVLGIGYSSTLKMRLAEEGNIISKDLIHIAMND